MQNINLYTEELQPQRQRWAFKQVATAIGGVSVVMLVLGIVMTLRANTAHSRMQELMAMEAGLQAQVEALDGVIQGRVQDPALVARNQEQEAMLRTRRDLREMIEKMAGESRPKFTELMKGLARQSANDAWLTGVGISDGGKQMQLSGQALLPEALPAYLTRLRDETSFRGRTFNLFALAEDEETRELNFELASQAGEGGAK